PTIALADAWATALDVLRFYQDRMVNESYIATAVEDRSIFELARMTGYGPDQGLAAKCYLSYTIDENIMRDVLIPARSKVRAIPRANEEPQIFETSKDLRARASWNSIKIATSRDFAIEDSSSTFYLRGTTTGLRIGDLLWVDRDKRSSYYLVQSVDVDRDTDSTATSVVLRSMPDPNFGKKTDVAKPELFSEKEQAEIDRQSSDAYYQMQTAGRAWIEENTIMAMARLSEAKAKEKPVEVTGFRKRARLFGHSAPRRLENPLDPKSESVPWNLDEDDKSRTDVVDLEGHHPTILQNAELCLEIPDRSVHGEDLEIYEILSVKLMSRTAYGTTGDITRLKLNRPWKSAHWTERYEEVVQKVIVHLDEVKLPLGRVPITSIGESKETGAAGGPASSAENTIELAGVYLGIEPGSRMILSGDPPKEEVPEDDREPELVEVKSVSHPPYPFGNAAARERRAEPTGTRTILEFVDLRHRYDPKKVKLSGNVVEATHGETYTEILGSGIGGREYQSFALARGPVTHLPATKFPGAKPELSVTVDGEEWTNVDTLARRVDGNRGFGLWTDETSKARVYFGNGE
ncbi:MAG: hypothetical protein Q7U75_00840, partial [Desulfobacterales bacterium]|nr:hypothetical protein [Desulfobacterales bacterium]